MAVRAFHLTPQGPRPCSVDTSKPKSKGCPLGGMHFDRFDDAMEVYSENLKSTFGEFAVLVRPSSGERIRRVGYRGRDSLETAIASSQVQTAVANLRAMETAARSAIAELRARDWRAESAGRPATLPDSIATEPLEIQGTEERQAENLSRKIFDSGAPESMADFGARISARRGPSPFHIAPLDRSELDRTIAIFDFQDEIRRAKPLQPNRADRMRIYRAKSSRRIATARNLASSAASALVTPLANVANRSISNAGYAVRASASLAAESAAIRSRAIAAKAQHRTQEIGVAARQRAARMSIPAAHVRPGDTFDGTTVRAVEALSDGRIKISYQATPGGPSLATTVAANRVLGVDRKTRREARNHRIASRMARPIAQSKELSQRATRASVDQLALLRSMRGRDIRFQSIEKALLRQERALKQRELVGRLRALRA